MNAVFSEDPVIVSPSKELTSQPVRVKLGNPWNATCKATGNPAPLVEWRRENGNEPVSPKLRDTNGAVLYMESVSQDDLGVYVCVAENSIKNSSKSTTARMEIGKFFFHHKKTSKNKTALQEISSQYCKEFDDTSFFKSIRYQCAVYRYLALFRYRHTA